MKTIDTDIKRFEAIGSAEVDVIRAGTSERCIMHARAAQKPRHISRARATRTLHLFLVCHPLSGTKLRRQPSPSLRALETSPCCLFIHSTKVL